MSSKVTVHDTGNGHFFLRVEIEPRLCGVVRFETAAIYSKPEADFRAVMLSCDVGFDRDELPTHKP